MRRLTAARARSVKEAEEKVLYLISATIAFKRPLSPIQVAAFASSVKPFKGEVRSLLQDDDQRREIGTTDPQG